MSLFTKEEIEKVDQFMCEHYIGHQSVLMSSVITCTDECRKLALMLAINIVIEDREEKNDTHSRS